MAYQDRAKQVLMKIETTSGTEQTLAAADGAGNFKNDSIDAGFKPGEYERDIVTGTITELGVLKSPLKQIMPRFIMEAAGGTATVSALWHAVMEMAGFLKVVVYKQTYDALAAAAPAVNDILADNATLASATKKHRVAKVVDNGDGTGTLWYHPLGATLAAAFGTAATLHNHTTTANDATSSAVAAAAKGFAFVPSEDTPDGSGGITPTKSGTVEIRTAGQRFTSVATKCGVTLGFNHGQPMTVEMTGAMGLPSGELDGGGLWRFRAAAPLTGVTLPSAPPRLMAAQSAKLDGLSIGITTLQVAVNNTIADRATIGLGDSATVPDCGYGIPSIVARRVEVSGDPEMPVKATLDLVSRVAEGEEMPLDIEVGQLTGPSAANGVICVYAPRLQLTGELPMQQRNGLVACNLTGKCIGSGSDELYVAHCFD